MNITYRIVLACVLFLCAPVANAAAKVSTPQQAAQYFSGLDAPASERKVFQKQTKTAWTNYEKLVGQPLLSWAAKEVAYSGGGTVFYPFSGPDFLTVERVYPNAGRYVLVAQQKALKPVYSESMNEMQRQNFEKKLGAAWYKFGILGYFRTEDLDQDQRDKSSSLGVTTILMAFAARLGYEVVDVAPLGFNASKGEWETLPASEPQWKSVRLSLQKEGRKVTLDYLSMDLSDDGLRAQKAQRDWMKLMAGQPTLLKAASHLLQEPYFEILSKMLVSAAPIVVQDETGLDYKDLGKIGTVKLYGNFIKPQVLFKTTRQPALAAAYKAEKNKNELPFAFSYLKKSEMRSLQIARRPQLAREAGQEPVPVQK
jgi:hypothetical protein